MRFSYKLIFVLFVVFASLGVVSAVCGDNVIDAGEVCDGTDLGGETCETQGQGSGSPLLCTADCLDFDYTNCVPIVLVCDAANLDLCTDPQECVDFGGFWYSDFCWDVSSGGCEFGNLDLCIDTDCTGAGGYWYDENGDGTETCNDDPQGGGGGGGGGIDPETVVLTHESFEVLECGEVDPDYEEAKGVNNPFKDADDNDIYFCIMKEKYGDADEYIVEAFIAHLNEEGSYECPGNAEEQGSFGVVLPGGNSDDAFLCVEKASGGEKVSQLISDVQISDLGCPGGGYLPTGEFLLDENENLQKHCVKYVDADFAQLCAPVAQGGDLSECKTRGLCQSSGQGYWYNGECNSIPLGECSADDLIYCNSAEECSSYGGEWTLVDPNEDPPFYECHIPNDDCILDNLMWTDTAGNEVTSVEGGTEVYLVADRTTSGCLTEEITFEIWEDDFFFDDYEGLEPTEEELEIMNLPGKFYASWFSFWESLFLDGDPEYLFIAITGDGTEYGPSELLYVTEPGSGPLPPSDGENVCDIVNARWANGAGDDITSDVSGWIKSENYCNDLSGTWDQPGVSFDNGARCDGLGEGSQVWLIVDVTVDECVSDGRDVRFEIMKKGKGFFEDDVLEEYLYGEAQVKNGNMIAFAPVSAQGWLPRIFEEDDADYYFDVQLKGDENDDTTWADIGVSSNDLHVINPVDSDGSCDVDHPENCNEADCGDEVSGLEGYHWDPDAGDSGECVANEGIGEEEMTRDIRVFVKDESNNPIVGTFIDLEKSGGDPVTGSPFETFQQGQTLLISDIVCTPAGKPDIEYIIVIEEGGFDKYSNPTTIPCLGENEAYSVHEVYVTLTVGGAGTREVELHIFDSNGDDIEGADVELREGGANTEIIDEFVTDEFGIAALGELDITGDYYIHVSKSGYTTINVGGGLTTIPSGEGVYTLEFEMEGGEGPDYTYSWSNQVSTGLGSDCPGDTFANYIPSIVIGLDCAKLTRDQDGTDVTHGAKNIIDRSALCEKDEAVGGVARCGWLQACKTYCYKMDSGGEDITWSGDYSAGNGGECPDNQVVVGAYEGGFLQAPEVICGKL
jgi:hypothetical protein